MGGLSKADFLRMFHKKANLPYMKQIINFLYVKICLHKNNDPNKLVELLTKK